MHRQTPTICASAPGPTHVGIGEGNGEGAPVRLAGERRRQWTWLVAWTGRAGILETLPCLMRSSIFFSNFIDSILSLISSSIPSLISSSIDSSMARGRSADRPDFCARYQVVSCPDWIPIVFCRRCILFVQLLLHGHGNRQDDVIRGG